MRVLTLTTTHSYCISPEQHCHLIIHEYSTQCDPSTTTSKTRARTGNTSIIAKMSLVKEQLSKLDLQGHKGVNMAVTYQEYDRGVTKSEYFA